jgi:hypothetical protein
VNAIFPSRRGMVPAIRHLLDALIAGFEGEMREFIDGLMFSARSGFDGAVITVQSPSPYDVLPNPDLILQYAREQ